MTAQPRITDTHTWDGSHTLPDWLHWDGHLILPGRDDTTPPQPGWTIVRWSDGHITIASPQVAARVYGTDGMRGRLERAEAELAKRAAGESADAAAGSYAGRAEAAEAQLAAVADLIADHEGDEWAAHPATTALRGILDEPATRWLHIAFTSPDETTANTSALAIADHLRAEFPGVGMRISSNAIEVGTHDARTTPAATEATGTWKEPTHPNPCTATIEGRATPGGRRVKCTREARHPENHVGPKLGANGRVLWTDHQPGATPHKEQP